MQPHSLSLTEKIIEHIYGTSFHIDFKNKLSPCLRTRIFNLKVWKATYKEKKSIRLSALEDPCFFMPLRCLWEQIKSIKAQLSSYIHFIYTYLCDHSVREVKCLNEWGPCNLFNKTERKRYSSFLANNAIIYGSKSLG